MMSPLVTVGALKLGRHPGKPIHLAASVESPIVISAGFRRPWLWYLTSTINTPDGKELSLGLPLVHPFQRPGHNGLIGQYTMSDITIMFHPPSTVSLAYVLWTVLANHITRYTQDFL